MEKANKRKGKIRVLLAILLILLALIILVFGFVWNKLDLLQFEDEKSDVVSAKELENEKENNKLSNVKGSADGTVVLDNKEFKLTSEEGYLTVGEAADDNFFVTPDEVKKFKDNTVPVIAPTVDKESSNGIVNILLIGTDENSDYFSVNAKSDSILLLSINKGNHTMKLIGFERAIGVPIEIGHYKGQYEWLSYMMRIGGQALLIETIEECFRVDIDGYARVNLRTFEQLIDSCGGVDINLTREEAEAIEYFNYGPQHLNGKYALRYSRLRKIDSDWGRLDRQKKVIQSCVTSAKSLSVSELNGLLESVLPLIQTNLSKTEIAVLILEAPNLVGKTVNHITLPKEGTYGVMQGFGGKNMLSVDFETNAKLLQDFIYG